MVNVKIYQLPPTKLVPNSPFPLLHYPGLIPAEQLKGDKVFDTFAKNGWETQWIYRYGPTQDAHYHSGTHECMAVLTGAATIRFGVADTVDDLAESTHGSGYEPGGIELKAKVGDVFVVPAGVCHKTHDTTKGSTFKLLTPGKDNVGSGATRQDIERVISSDEFSGYTMIGSYPFGYKWDFAKGGHDEGQYEKVWAVPKPPHDPILGDSDQGLRRLWKDPNRSKL